MADLIDITYEKFSRKRIAAKDIEYMELHDKIRLDKYRLLHKKGDMYSIVKFLPFPHLEKVPYKESYFEYRDFFGTKEIKAESELLAENDDILIEDNAVYRKPCIILRYAEERRFRIWFDTCASAQKAWDNFRYRFGDGLKFIV